MRPITVKWLNESETILLFIFKRSFTSQDYLDAVKYSRILVDRSNTNNYDVVADISDITTLPSKFIPLMRSEYRKPDDRFSNITVLVGASQVIRHLLSIFKEIFASYQFYCVDSLEEAVEILAKH